LAGPDSSNVAEQNLHEPGFFLSSTSDSSPHTGQTNTFFGCLTLAERRYPGKRSIAFPQEMHFFTLTQRKYWFIRKKVEKRVKGKEEEEQ